jgi:large subunit ribosomal protein L5
MNAMRNPRIEKITLNIGAGKDTQRLEKGVILLKAITGIEPLKTVTQKRIPNWGLRPGLPIGCKITLRKKSAEDLLKRLLVAKENKLKPTQFDEGGNISFGIPEYIEIPGVAYDPKIGIIGLEVCVTLERPGYRIKRRRLLHKKVPRRHALTREDSMAFMKKNFNVTVGEAE